MVHRQKTLASFGAGPFATGDTGGGRFGHYTFDDDAPKLLGILLAEFDNSAGTVIKHYVPQGDLNVEATFQFTTSLIIPKPSMFCHSFALAIKALNCRVLMFPVGLDHPNYQRGRFTFNMSFIVDMTSSAETMYEPIVQKCAEYLIELEIEYNFLTNPKYQDQLFEVMDKMYRDLSTKGESVVEVHLENDQIMTMYFKLCPSYRGLEPPEIDYYMVPMFIRDIELTERLIEKMDVLSQKIIPKIDGITTVREIAIQLELDPSLVARCVRNLHFYECVSLVPMFLYWNTYVATERVHDFYKNQSEISDCLEFVKIQSAIAEDGSEIPMPNPEFSDVFRLYLSMKVPENYDDDRERDEEEAARRARERARIDQEMLDREERERQEEEAFYEDQRQPSEKAKKKKEKEAAAAAEAAARKKLETIKEAEIEKDTEKPKKEPKRKNLAQWVLEEKPRSMGIDEHRLVQFGMHHRFLRKLSSYPICTVNPGNNSLLKACNGKTSLDELALQHNVDPGSLYELLHKSRKFEFVMK